MTNLQHPTRTRKPGAPLDPSPLAVMPEAVKVPALDYEARLKELLAPVNALFEAAAKDGIYLGLYLMSYEGGDAGTYGSIYDCPKADHASLTRVCTIEFFDENELRPEDDTAETELSQP